jgi:hypothetical protein
MEQPVKCLFSKICYSKTKLNFLSHKPSYSRQTHELQKICSWKTLNMPYKKSKRRCSKELRKDRTQKELKVDA